MLREGLRQELPELFDLAARVPRPYVARMPAVLAAIAGLGAQWLALQLIRGTISTANLLLQLSVRTAEATDLISWAIGTIIAFASGRVRGAALFAVAALAIEALKIVLALPSVLLFCERSGQSDCADVSRLLQGAWPLIAGLLVGIAARHAIRPGPAGRSALALGAACVALSIPIIRVLTVASIGPAPEGQIARSAVEWIVGGNVIAAFAMGVVAGRLGRRHLVDAGLIATAYLLLWLPQFVTWVRDRPTFMPRFVLEMDWPMFVPVALATAALIGLAIGATFDRLSGVEARAKKT